MTIQISANLCVCGRDPWADRCCWTPYCSVDTGTFWDASSSSVWRRHPADEPSVPLLRRIDCTIQEWEYSSRRTPFGLRNKLRREHPNELPDTNWEKYGGIRAPSNSRSTMVPRCPRTTMIPRYPNSWTTMIPQHPDLRTAYVRAHLMTSSFRPPGQQKGCSAMLSVRTSRARRLVCVHCTIFYRR